MDTTAAVTAEAFRACLEQVAADDGVDSVLAVTVPTAISDLTAAWPRPRPQAAGRRPARAGRCVRLLPAVAPRTAGARRAGASRARQLTLPALAGSPAYAYPEDAARALGHAARYQGWRGRQDSQVPELGGLRAEAARS